MARRLSACAFVLALVLTACGKNLNLGEKSPGDTIRSLYTACNEGRYSEVEPLLSENLRAAMKSPQGVSAGGVKKMCDFGSRNGTIVRVEIVKEEVRGEGAVVTANIVYKDGPPEQDERTDLIKEGGAWRVVGGSSSEKASAETSTPNGLAAVKGMIEANPDLETVKSDEAAGTVTIRNKKTNEVATVSVEDIKSGRIKIKTSTR